MSDVGKPMLDIIGNCMAAAKYWGVIQKNPGDMAYIAPAQ